MSVGRKPFIRFAYLSAHLRAAASSFQYQDVVMREPAKTSGSASTSLRKSRPTATFIALSTPNCFTCFIELTVSVPALKRPSTCAPEFLALSRYDEKSVVAGNGYKSEPCILPPLRSIAAVKSASIWVPNASLGTIAYQVLPFDCAATVA